MIKDTVGDEVRGYTRIYPSLDALRQAQARWPTDESREWTLGHILEELQRAGYCRIMAAKGEYGSGPQWERDLFLFHDVGFGRVYRGEERMGGPWVYAWIQHVQDDGQRHKKGDVMRSLLEQMRKSPGHLFICQETATEIEIRMP